MQVHPYLNFRGQCEEAFKFYAECFGGKITAMFTHGDTPIAEHVPAEMHKMIMHASMEIGNTRLMGSDAPPDRYEKSAGSYVSLHLEDPAQADRIFKALAENGEVEMDIQKTFWSERFGMVVDRFGIPWMINCAPEGA